MHFSVLVTNTSKISTKAQLEPFSEDGEESDYWIKKIIKCPGGLKNYRSYIEKNFINYYNEAISKTEGDARWQYEQLAKWGEAIKSDNEAFVATSIAAEEGYSIDNKGNLYIAENPNAKWDWWVEGGRFRIATVKGENAIYCKAKDIDCGKTVTSAILHNGIWVDGSNFKGENWCEKFRKIVSDLDPELDVTIVDCHI